LLIDLLPYFPPGGFISPALERSTAYIKGELATYEGVCVRNDHTTSKYYRKFYGEKEVVVPQKNELANDAFRYGDPITQAEYEATGVAERQDFTLRLSY
jgi:hypothetical protein